MKRSIALLFALIAFAFSACSDDSKVGSGVKVTGDAKGSGLRLGETTTTQAPTMTTAAPTEASAAPVTTAKAVTTTAAPTTTARPVPVFEIAIYGDSSGQNQFEPSRAGVRKGTVVRWVNKDSVERAVEATNGAFKSPPIAPGASWEYTTTQAGTFDYQDSTRPYAVAQLVVV